MPASRPSGTNVVQVRDQRTASVLPPSAYTGTPASPRLRVTGMAVHPPPSTTAGGAVEVSRRVAARPWATDPSWRKLGQAVLSFLTAAVDSGDAAKAR